MKLINNLILRLNEAGEIIIKTISDYWIVGKLSNLREFFVIIQQKSASIIEIDGKSLLYFIIFSLIYFFIYFMIIIQIFIIDEVKRLCEKQLKSIFFH